LTIGSRGAPSSGRLSTALSSRTRRQTPLSPLCTRRKQSHEVVEGISSTPGRAGRRPAVREPGSQRPRLSRARHTLPPFSTAMPALLAGSPRCRACGIVEVPRYSTPRSAPLAQRLRRSQPRRVVAVAAAEEGPVGAAPPAFDARRAVLLAKAAFEAYNDPRGATTRFRDVDAAGTEANG